VVHRARAKAQIERRSEAYRLAFGALVEAIRDRPEDEANSGIVAATEGALTALLESIARLEPVFTADLEAPAATSLKAVLARARAERDPRLALDIADFLSA
jgi:hypothetical protein